VASGVVAARCACARPLPLQRARPCRLAAAPLTARVRPAAFKIGLDSLINGSVSILSSFSLWSLLDGDSVESLRSKLQKKFRETWLMDWKVWPLYNLLCFSMIPLSLRPLSSGFASTAWNAFISHQSQRVA